MADYVEAPKLFNALLAVKSTIATKSLMEQHERQIVGLLIVLGAFPDLYYVDQKDNGEEYWIRETAERLSVEGPQRSNPLGPALKALERSFRARTTKLLANFMRERYSYNSARDVLCAIVETGRLTAVIILDASGSSPLDFGRSILAAVSDVSELLKMLEAVRRDTHWIDRAQRVTDLLIIFGSLPSFSRDTERYWEKNRAELLPAVEWSRPGVQRAFDRIVRPFCNKAPKIVEDLVNVQLSPKDRSVLDMLVYSGVLESLPI